MSHNLWLIRFLSKVKIQKCPINGGCKESWFNICNENSYNGLDGRTSKIWFYSQRLGFWKKSLMYRYQTRPDSQFGRILDGPVNVLVTVQIYGVSSNSVMVQIWWETCPSSLKTVFWLPRKLCHQIKHYWDEVQLQMIPLQSCPLKIVKTTSLFATSLIW